MGAGKTTLGGPIAEKLGWQFIDLDTYIENRRHKTVNELFEQLGEKKFRELERDILREVATFEQVVIATGGGTPCYYDNLAQMKEAGLVIFLRVSMPILFERLKKGKRKRPKLRDKKDEELLQVIEDGLQDRLPIYSQAHVAIQVDDLNNVKSINKAALEISSLLTKV